MKCEFCPAAWEDRSYEGECNDCGCRIMGHDMVGDDCSLSLKEVNRRLDQLEDYHNGKIERPQWVTNRFIRELDACNSMFGLDLGLPAYPPKKTNNSLYKSIYGRIDITYSEYSAYRQGYEDAKKGLEENPYKHYDRQPEKKKAENAVYIVDKLKSDIKKMRKELLSSEGNQDYITGFVSALSNIEGAIAMYEEGVMK